MKKLFLSTTLLGLSAFAFAESEEIYVSNVRYEVFPDEGYAIVGDNTKSATTKPEIQSSVEYNNISYPVTEIAAEAWMNNTSAYLFRIPPSIKKIGEDAFKNCRVTEIYISDADAWASIEFANYYASPCAVASTRDNHYFYINDVSDFNSILTLSEKVTKVSPYAFCGVKFKGVSLPSTLISIGRSAFQSCANLSEINIPDGVTEIGSACFRYCSSLKSVNLPESLSLLEGWTFADCENLENISIPEKVTFIDQYAFMNCSSLTSVKVGNVEEYGYNAFTNCQALSQVTTTNIGAWMSAKYKTESSNPLYYARMLKVAGMDDSEISGIEEGITKVSKYAFINCTSLNTIKLPNSVETIEEEAFRGCINLSYINLGKGLKEVQNNAFKGCQSIANVYLGAYNPPECSNFDNSGAAILHVCEGRPEVYKAATGWKNFLEIIADLDVNGNEKFATYGINESGTGAMLIKANSDIVSVTIPDITYIDDKPYNVTSICAGAFSNCKNLTDVTFLSSLTEIGDYAFYGCNNLSTVVTGDNLETIGDHAFGDCWVLRNISLPENLEYLGVGAFENCISITSVTIPGNLSTISANAYSGCSGLINVNISEGVNYIREEAFKGCRKMKAITIPGSIYEIDEYAFADCYNLAEILFERGIRAIGSYAFKNCSSISTLILPEDVDYIGECAFWNCSGLLTVSIPSSVSSIGASAFYGCQGLNDIYCLAQNPPSCDSYRATFQNYNAVLHVPKLTSKSYSESREWNKFSTILEDAGTTSLIDDIDDDTLLQGDVFNLNGIRVLRNATETDIKSLPVGYYILNGKKIINL